MGVIVGCNHMGWGILGERLQLVTSILIGFRPHVVTDSAGVFAGFGYSPWYAAYPPGIRGTWFARNCGVFRPQWGQFPGPNRCRADWFYMRKTHLTFALKRAIAYARARIRVQALLRECRPWMQPHGAPWRGCFCRNATYQSGPVGRFEALGRVGILSNAPKRLLGALSWLPAAFFRFESLYPMP